MPELPDYMLREQREVDPEFEPDEQLYRRVPHAYWDDDEVELDAIEFPDMSVQRGKYGPPESARWDRGKYVNWGVIGFEVQDIPAEIPFQGMVIYKMRPVHVPLKKNYPHSEVQIFESKCNDPGSETHIVKNLLEGVTQEAQQIWRELLRRKCRIILRVGEQDQK
jgi:hypothetical protein